MSDVNAVAVVHYQLTDGTKGYVELPAQTLDEGIEAAMVHLDREIELGEDDYVGYTITKAKWGVATNWIGAPRSLV